MKKFGKVGFVGRFKPLHIGGELMLDTFCTKAKHVVIGLGSCNRYNMRNPFSASESMEMINRTLQDKHHNYSFVYVPDFGHIPEFSDGQMWRHYILEAFGELNYFISGNGYVTELLKNDYKIIRPSSEIPRSKQIKLKATQVRYEMVAGGDWKSLVPRQVAEYLEEAGLVERFRDEFGLETLAELAETDYWEAESATQERANVQYT